MSADPAHVGAHIHLLLALRAKARQTESLLARVAAERRCSSADCLLLWELAGLAGQVGHRRPSDLTAACGLASSTVALRLAHLEASGLVTRVRESGDRRAVAVHVTPAGALLARATFDDFVAGAGELVDVSGSGQFAPVVGGTLHACTQHTEEES